MKFKSISILLVLFASVIFLSGCVEGDSSATSIARSLPEVQSFLNDYPNAEIKAVLWNSIYVGQKIDEIRAECGEQMPIEDYWFVSIKDEVSEIKVYISQDTNDILCAIKPAVESNYTDEIIINPERPISTSKTCSDGTLLGQCSETKPLFCYSSGTLSEVCSRCGCDSGYTCRGDGLCYIKEESSTTDYFCYSDEGCEEISGEFLQKFTSCEPGITMTAGVKGFAVYKYEIIGTKNNGCQIKTKYTENINPDWVGKEMKCVYENSLNFNDAANKLIENTFEGCEGELYYLMTGTSETGSTPKTINGAYDVRYTINAGTIINYDSATVEFISGTGTTSPMSYFKITGSAGTLVTSPALGNSGSYEAIVDGVKVRLTVSSISYDAANLAYKAVVSLSVLETTPTIFEGTYETRYTLTTSDSIKYNDATVLFVSGTGTTTPYGYFKITGSAGTSVTSAALKTNGSYEIIVDGVEFRLTVYSLGYDAANLAYKAVVSLSVLETTPTIFEGTYGTRYTLTTSDSIKYNDATVLFVSGTGTTTAAGYFKITGSAGTVISSPALGKDGSYVVTVDGIKFNLTASQMSYDAANVKYTATVSLSNIYELQQILSTGQSITMLDKVKVEFVSGTGTTTTAGYFKITGPNGTALTTAALTNGGVHIVTVDGRKVKVEVITISYDAANVEYSSYIKIKTIPSV